MNIVGTQTLQIVVNVINQLKLLRQSTFKDKLTFIDEDVQNAQRAKASEVRVTYNYFENKLIIENNGQVLLDPQVLFSMSESGWDDDVMNSENPFGIGFFSNITVSDLIEVYSANRHVIFDIGEMISQNRTDLKVEILDDYYEGFKLVLNNVSNEIYESEIKERVNLLGRYVQDLAIYYNGELQEKKDLTEGDDSVFQIKIDEDASFLGWLAFNQGFGDGINIFYKGRLVKKLTDFYYLKGDIHVNDKVLNLTSPDRKDIIIDKKYSDFRDKIRSYAKKLSEDSIMNGKQSDVDQYSSALSFYADKEELKSKIKFMMFKGSESEDVKYLKGVALAVKKEGKEKIKSLNDYEILLKKQEEGTEEGNKEISFVVTLKTEVPEPKGVIEHPKEVYSGSGRVKEAWVEKPEIDEKQLVERTANIILNAETPTFWMKFNEIEFEEEKFNIINHYKLKLVVARNRFEEEVLKAMKDENVLHISELKEEVTISANVSNTKLSKKEKRAEMLLTLLSEISGFEHNVFVIGDVMVTKTTEVETLNTSFVSIEENVTVVADTVNSKVYVDRNTIENSMLTEDLTEELTLTDYKFILANLTNFIKEISLLEFDKEIDLYKTTIQALSIA